jgi:hypothetical protein
MDCLLCDKASLLQVATGTYGSSNTVMVVTNKLTPTIKAYNRSKVAILKNTLTLIEAPMLLIVKMVTD